MTANISLLAVLTKNDVEFILVGGLAAIVHGSARVTFDIDVVYKREKSNHAKLVCALAPFAPYPRGAPPGLPFSWSSETLDMGLNFTLHTSLGDIDLLGEIPGNGTFPTLAANSLTVSIEGAPVRVVDLPTLIRLKRAGGRPKDYEALAELEGILGNRLA